MSGVGRTNMLKVIRRTESGFLLDGGSLGDVFMPRNFSPKGMAVGDAVEVFVYPDPDGRLLATPERPHVMAGEYALLKVSAITPVGAFLDWGLKKDLLAPFGEQKHKMEEGKSYIVYVYLDEETKRIVASSKLNRFLGKEPPAYREGQSVDLLVFGQTVSGYRVIVDNAHWGMLYKNEVFQDLHRGDRVEGTVRKVREDGKVDVRLQSQGPGRVDIASEKILDVLRKRNGFVAVTDHTAADVIYELFGMSKRTYKKAVGTLYRRRVLAIEEEGIRLTRDAG